jgi:transcriptional regulator with AAA-type ATPase domain
MLLEARSMPEIAQLVAERNDQAARVLAAELREVSAQPREAAVLLVSATIEVALQELTAGRRLPRYRAALRNLIPSSAQSRPRR